MINVNDDNVYMQMWGESMILSNLLYVSMIDYGDVSYVCW